MSRGRMGPFIRAFFDVQVHAEIYIIGDLVAK